MVESRGWISPILQVCLVRGGVLYVWLHGGCKDVHTRTGHVSVAHTLCIDVLNAYGMQILGHNG